jgi:hypothetical protein
MKITSDRWQIVSAAIILVGMLWFAKEAFSRGAVHDVAWGGFLLWNALWFIPFYWWWWPRRQAVQAATKEAASPGPMLRLAAVAASGLAGAALPLVGGRLLEQDGLGLQVLGGVLLAVASLIAPGWCVWSIRWWTGRTTAPTV